MLYLLIPEIYHSLLAPVGIIFAFAATVFATAKLADVLPKDGGREFAHDGKLSAGKPRGAGIIFVLAFVAAAVFFCTDESGDGDIPDFGGYLYDDGISGRCLQNAVGRV